MSTKQSGLNITLAGQTGTGTFVGATSPTLVTPTLGTPTSGVLTNCTGYPPVIGSIVQTQFSALLSGSSSSSATYVDVTGADLVITPTSASNVILVMFNWQYNAADVSLTNTYVENKILSSVTGSLSGTLQFGCGTATVGANTYGTGSFIFVDSPATTSAVTYKIQQQAVGGGSVSTTSVSIVLMEVAAV